MTSTDSRGIAGQRRLLSLGYHDGTTNGLVKFDKSGLAFRYDLVAWDSGEEWRVFCLSPLASNDFEVAVQALSDLGDPKWPCWFPIWEFSSEAKKNDAEAAVEATLNRCGRYQFAILSRDLCTSILAVATTVADFGDAAEKFSRDRKLQPFDKWLDLFGATVLEYLVEPGPSWRSQSKETPENT